MFFLKFKYLLYYYKSKVLKKKCKKDYKDEKIQFEQKINKKNFSNKWFLNNFSIFNYFLPKDKNAKFDYLEIGCFEGLSSFYVLSKYNAVNAFLIDVWDMPNSNSKTLSNDFDKVEKAFDDNLSEYTFTKIKDDSVVSMRKLLKQDKSFDFIYIDGSHNGEDILSDAIEAFKILKKDGLIFFDDFLQYDKNRDLQSYEGIEKFLTLYSNFLKIEYFQNNLVVRKR
ncbi:class I SAM-dependent methyltransferase [Candidatus Pelagibacter sp. HIMB1483]|uniref:class I SAM-dependent methyltransferase n=1 Tax=Candidatus Pelagibacter sp. HIMB1483 TaxID=3415414 RepID=UPI003F83DD92